MGQQNDRGTIKWTSLMLPEHVEMVKEIYKEQNKVDKPLLDEQQIQDHTFLLEMRTFVRCFRAFTNVLLNFIKSFLTVRKSVLLRTGI
ncbi:YolD-like family protein [Jeotgalibacillus proteolyticus]|uniref:YolD-like family protein n=1 Tax=Jeotgalibacillus proteolyticus TaxID=2082395 RepID=UPI003CFBC237